MSKKYEDRSTDYGVRDVLVTGATGLIGRWLVPELLRRGHRVLALVRNASRRTDVVAMLDRRGEHASRLVLLEGDLDAEELGLDAASRASLAQVSQVFHLGASFAWGLTEEVAVRTNVRGTERVVELAASLPRSPRLVLVGGYRVAPRRTPRGEVRVPVAKDFADAGAYEASKFHAHVRSVALAEKLGVPYTVVHPSSVIGDSRTGETTQVTGLGETILALARGKLPARAWGARTFVPLVPVDFVATFLASIAERDDAIGRELTLLDADTPELDALIDRAASRLSLRAPWLRAPTWLVRALPESITQASREALGFLDDARYPTEDTDAFITAMGLARPDIESAFDLWVDHLVRADVAQRTTSGTDRSTLTA